MRNRLFSVDSAKAVKAQEYGWLNAIHYMAPADLSGTNLCPHSSAACRALCLGWFSGQASMVANDADINSVRQSRITKARRFMHDRAAYLLDMVRCIDNLATRAARQGMGLCVRPNGATDIPFEGIKFRIDRNARGKAVAVTLDPISGLCVMDHYPSVSFVDYTKNPRRFDRKLPANYHLTFSRSEENEQTALALLARGVNVAAVFGCDKPSEWNGFAVIDGDLHDLRQLDPRGARGVVIALSPKGPKARRDQTGFVIRSIPVAAAPADAFEIMYRVAA